MSRIAAWWSGLSPAAREAQRKQEARWAEARERSAALVEYVHAHRGMDDEVPEALSGEVLRLAPRLFDEGVAVEEKRFLLLVFAHAESDTALTALEAYVRVARGRLRYFAEYAVQEARARKEPFRQTATSGSSKPRAA